MRQTSSRHLHQVARLILVGTIFLLQLPVHGQVIAWGRNAFGETNVPANLSNVVSIAAGGWNSMALQGGSYRAWGMAPLWGEPGDATNIVAIACGGSSSMLLRADGKVTVFGDAPGVPADMTNAIAVAKGAAQYLALRPDGTVRGWGGAGYGDGDPPAGLSNVVSVTCGEYHSLAVRADGTVVAWGWGALGQTNIPTGLSNVVTVAAGYSYNLALKSDGTLAAWGSSTNFPAGLTNVLAIASGLDHFLALKSDGAVVAWGDNTYGETDLPAGLTNVIGLAAGYGHSVVLMGGGSPQLFQQPVGATVLAGFPYVFKAQATGTLPLHYQWQFNATNIPGANSAALLLTNVQFSAQGLYSVLASNASGTTLSSNAQIVVLPLKITSQPTNQTVFGGDTVLLAVSAQGTSLRYFWNFNGTFIPNQTNSSLTLSNITTGAEGAYSVIVSNAYGSLQTSNAQLTVVPIAITTQPLDQSVFEADDASYTVAADKNGPFSYQWRFNGTNLLNQTNATLVLPTVATNQAGSYSVLVANPYGSVESSNAQLVISLPYIVSHPSDSSIYGGDNTSFSVSVVGPKLSYQWQLNGTNLPGATNTSLAITTATTNHAGVYAAFASNPYRTLTSSNATLTVTPLSITTPPSSRSAYIGDSTTFTVSVLKNGPFTYQWRFQGNDLPDKTNSSLTLTGLTTNNAGWYSVFVSNPYGSVESSGANLNVLNSKPIITTQPVSRGAYLGNSTTFIVAVDGTKPMTCQWFHDGAPVFGATATNLALSNLTPADTGAYSVLVSNAVGTTLSSNATLVFLNVKTWGQTNNFGIGIVPLDLTNAVAVAVGNSHSVALKPNGRVVVWGYNGSGQTNVPASASNVVAIAAGQDHTLALRSNGTVVAWGNGGTGVPAGLSNVIAVSAGDYHSMALKSNGTVVAWGDGGFVSTTTTNVPASATNVIAIAAGGNFCVALKANGSVVSWGSVASMPTFTNAVAIAANEFPVVVLKADGKVFATNVLAAPAGLSNVVGVVAQRYTASALKSDGTVTNWGSGGPVTPAGLSNVTMLASGQYHCLAILGNGPQSADIPFTNPNWASNAFSLSLPTLYGKLYWLEYKNSLDETNWKSLSMNLGSGATLSLTNSPATNAQRFYRVRQW